MSSSSSSIPEGHTPGSSTSFDLKIFDEQLDQSNSEAPETQRLRKALSQPHFIRKFPPPRNEISESALAEGFSFGPRAPVRPGQFSERPHHKATSTSRQKKSLNASRVSFESAERSGRTEPKPIPIMVSQATSKSRGSTPRYPQGQPRHSQGSQSLELFELAFEGSPETSVKSPPQPIKAQVDSPPRVVNVPRFSRNEDDVSSSPSTAVSDTQSFVPERFSLADPQDIQRINRHSKDRRLMSSPHITTLDASEISPLFAKSLSPSVQECASRPSHYVFEKQTKPLAHVSNGGGRATGLPAHMRQTVNHTTPSPPIWGKDDPFSRQYASHEQSVTNIQVNDAAGRVEELPAYNTQANHVISSSPPVQGDHTCLPRHRGSEEEIKLHAQDNAARGRVQELPAHIQRQGHIRHQRSSSSACGDLEPPTNHVPRRLHHLPGDTSNYVTNRPMRPQRNYEKASDSQPRSQSRTSNISIKRSAIHKSRAHRDPGRKKLAMFQVAEYWNQCMLIAEEEKEEANDEIERLQDEVVRQCRKMEEAQALLSQKQSHIQTIEDRCKSLEERDSGVTDRNDKLSGEIEELRNQLAESKGREAQLTGKTKTYKKKINEVIVEQQNLYKQSREYCERTLKAIREDEGIREERAREIDEALKVSQHKREEMRKVFQEFQAHVKQESEHKDELILDLKIKIKDSETSLLREQELAEQLRAQILKAQSNMQQSIQDLETKVDSLVDICGSSGPGGRESTETSAELFKKMDIIMGYMKSSAENAQRPFDIEPLMQGLEDRVVSRMLTTVSQVTLRQDRVEETISRLGGALGTELLGINKTMSSYIKQRQEEISHETVDQRLSKSLDFVASELKKTRDVCGDIEERINTMTSDVREALETTSDSRQTDITRQLQERDDVINERDRQLQLLSEDYAAKIEAMSVKIMDRDRTAHKGLQDAIAQLTAHLDTAFEQARKVSSEKLRQSEEANSALKSQLDDARARLADINPNPTLEVDELRQRLHHEQGEIATLKQQIQRFEHETKRTGALQIKWYQDIAEIDGLREKLTAAYQRMPRVESMAAKLENITRMNNFIHSTANYLATEKNWVRHELAARGESQSTSAVVSGAGGVSHGSSTQNIWQPLSIEDGQYVTDEQFAHLRTIVEEELAPRKVLVRVEADCHSPSPPPSVEQEKRRRRETSKPRSIMRAGKGFEQSSHVSEARVAERLLHYSQYNRPVISETTRATRSRINDGMVEQIRSGFVPAERVSQEGTFPTIATFLKSSQQVNSQESFAGDKHMMLGANGSNGRNAKRFKVEPETSPGDLKPSRPRSARALRPQMLRTYSRKISD